jgi:CRP/FNR family transcriptional regulator, cyclic AMP receptor protein
MVMEMTAATATPAPPAPRDQPLDRVQVFRHEPDLLCDLDEVTAEHLRRRAIAPALRLDPGAWTPPDIDADESCLGLLLIEGLLSRRLRIGGRECCELLGAGDLLRPWDADDAWPVSPVGWKALTPVTIAVLDARFAAIAGRWPPVFARLLQRTSARSQGLAFHLALAGVRRAEPRLLLVLTHLAERWGRVTPSGVVLPLPLTHELLAHLACLRRPTVTVALHALMRSGKLDRRPDGTWVLLDAGDVPREAPVAA